MDVERVFSVGRRALTHVRSRLSAQTTRALLCVGAWSRLDLVQKAGLRVLSGLADVQNDDDDYEMEDGWDRIEAVLSARRDSGST